MHFDSGAYLERIGVRGPVEPGAAMLARIHRAQAYTIPFENFDILLGRRIDIGPAAIFDKLVGHRRGGYCFELNQLLHAALLSFGFSARLALARVHLGPEPTGHTHVLVIVSMDGQQWLADVGFGANSPRAPLRLQHEVVQAHDGLEFRLVAAPPYGSMLEQREGGRWRSLYSFELRPVLPVDLELGNHFTSTHPRSFFTWAAVAHLPGPSGRAVLFDDRLTIERDGATTEQAAPRGPAFIDMLATRFGIELDAPFEAIQPLNPRPSPRAESAAPPAGA